MPRALFSVYWNNSFQPITIDPGEHLNLDTGRLTDLKGWHRNTARFSFDGHTVTMERITETNHGTGMQRTHGIWTCPLPRLNAERRELAGVTVLIPAWVDSAARLCDGVCNGACLTSRA